MEAKLVDARGLSCPQPVILAIAAAAGGKPFDILVDNDVSCENILRFAGNNAWQTQVRKDGFHFVISLTKQSIP